MPEEAPTQLSPSSNQRQPGHTTQTAMQEGCGHQSWAREGAPTQVPQGLEAPRLQLQQPPPKRPPVAPQL